MNLILSADENWGLGKDNRLLFRIKPDIKAFSEKTHGGVVIMGRKTLESLPEGKPLAGRVNLVLTRDPSKDGDGKQLIFCRSVRDLSLRLNELAPEPANTWVIGGAEIYLLLLPYCKEAYVTRVLAAAAEVDCYMVDLDQTTGWAVAERGALQVWEGLRFRYDRYVNLQAIALADHFPEGSAGISEGSSTC